MPANWNLLPAPPADVVGVYPHHPIVAALMHQRGITPLRAAEFTQPLDRALTDPFALKDMDRAVDRILKAIDGRESIVVVGDYDADGITAQAVVIRAFDAWNIPVARFVPRRKDGYGLRAESLVELAKTYTLAICVDTGSNNGDAVAAAQEAGLDIIIADHHPLARVPPPAVAVVNPQRGGAIDLTELAGVGVAFFLIRALGKTRYGIPDNLDEILSLVATGTIGDMVPLGAENRTLVAAGLAAIRSGQGPGVQALLKAAGVNAAQADAETIGFQVAPRLNAPGRMALADDASDVLIERDAGRRAQAADRCDLANTARKEETARYLAQAHAHLADAHGKNPLPRVLMVGDPDWNAGIVGLIAGRLTELHRRPTLCYRKGDSFFKGSARSVPGVSLVAAAEAHGGLFHSFGGHAGAAGFSFDPDREGEIAAALDAWATQFPDDCFLPRLTVDLEIDHDAVDLATVEALESLAPFDRDTNRTPHFLIRGVHPAAPKTMSGGQHLAFFANLRGARNVKAVGWGMGHRLHELNRGAIDLVATLSIDQWKSKRTVQLTIKDHLPAA